MADETTTGVQETTTAIGGLSDALKSLGLSSDISSHIIDLVVNKLKALGSVGKEAATSILGMGQANNQTAASMNQLGGSAETSLSIFDKLKTLTKESTNGFNLLGATALGASTLLSKFDGDKTMSSFSEQIKGVISDANQMTAPFADLAKSMGIDIGGIVSGPLFEALKTKIIGIGEAIEQHMTFQRVVFNMAAETGQMNTFLGNVQTRLGDLGNISKDYEMHLNAVSQATHTSLESAKDFFASLSQLPPTLDASKDGAQRLSDQMGQMATNITLAHGSGQQFSDVIGQSDKLLETFNVKMADVNQITVEGAELTKMYGVNIKDTTGFLSSMADTFQMLGDNTQGVTGIFNEFFQGLRDGGLGIKPAIETIKEMGKSLADMDVAHRALLSARTGGPGGLLGGLEIQRDLAAGKSKEVMDRVQKSFTQFAGGKITTLDQVNDQASASRYQKEVQGLMSGTFGVKAGSEGQAAAMLKAFSKPGGMDMKSANDALKDVMQQGTDYQKLSYTKLDDIYKSVDVIKMQGGATGADIVQDSATSRAGGAVAGYLDAATKQAEEIVKRSGGGGKDLSQRYSNDTMGRLGQGMEFGPELAAFKEQAKQQLGLGGGAISTTPAAPEDNPLARLNADEASLKSKLSKGGALSGNMSHAQLMAGIAADEAAKKKYNLGANHQATTAKGGKAVAGTHQGHAAAGTHQGHAAAGTAQTSAAESNMLNATINVFVDGKKVQQDMHRQALDPSTPR